MRLSKPRGAVFTPAMPHLEGFLSRHVRPDHPLRHHPLWLSERDLASIQKWKFDPTSLQHSGKTGETQNPPMLLVQVPTSNFFFNMDQLVPENEIHWQLPLGTTPMSVTTLKAYGTQVQEKLERHRVISGFKSNWWGTQRQWEKKGCTVRPNEYPVPVLNYFMARILHISMLSGGEDLLKNIFVSGRTGYVRPLKSTADCHSNDGQFVTLVSEHYGRHRFQSPLYFSGSALQSAGIAIRPDADPLDLSSLGTASHNEPGAAAPVSNDAHSYTQYYHLSQVLLPENYRIPANVLEAERLNPGVPIHGMTGKVLNIPELQYEAILNSPSPELAAFIARDDETEPLCLFLDMESPHTVHGRSLWYLPHDVLEAGGFVDVNAVPVEVRVADNSLRKFRMLYNVEQLVLPLQGYRAVGRIACMKAGVAEDRLPQSPDESDGTAMEDAGHQSLSF